VSNDEYKYIFNYFKELDGFSPHRDSFGAINIFNIENLAKQ
jgi:hypothetical protein